MNTNRIKKNLPAVVVFLVVVMSVYIIYGFVNTGSSNQANNETVQASQTIVMYASYRNSYQTLADMAKAASLIVVASVDTTNTEKRLDMVFTNYIVKVDTIIQDKRTKNNKDMDKFIIQQTGGTYDYFTTPYISGQPDLQTSKKYLFFLEETSEKYYLICGGVEGAYEIKDDILSDITNDSNPLKKTFQGKGLDSIIEELKSVN